MHSDRAIFIWNDGRIISYSLTSFFAFLQYFSILQVLNAFSENILLSNHQLSSRDRKPAFPLEVDFSVLEGD